MRADYAAACTIDRRWYGRVRMQAGGFGALAVLFLLQAALYDTLEDKAKGAFQVTNSSSMGGGARLGGDAMTACSLCALCHACRVWLAATSAATLPSSCAPTTAPGRCSTSCPLSSTSLARIAPPGLSLER